MLEKMSDFFEARLSGYDAHMMHEIAFADEFYPFTARQLPKSAGDRILDLGCGTGLELEAYYALGGEASILGIDLSRGMLDELRRKMKGRAIDLVLGSYFDVPFGDRCFDAAVSVESLHHFTKDEKVALYKKLSASLKENGCFILTDYFADSDEAETRYRKELLAQKAEQGCPDDVLYHFDTPLTVEHEMQALREGGFSSVDVLRAWGATKTIRAVRSVGSGERGTEAFQRTND